jgi:hypothetical protein
VVDVAGEVERQVLLVQQDRGVVIFGACLFEFGDGGVGAVDVACVVFAVVQLVDLTRDVRLQCSVVPVQVGQSVFSHGLPSFE